MIAIKQTDTYQRWERKLRDSRAKALIAARIFRLANGLAGDVKPVGQASVNCVFIMVQDIVSILNNAVTSLSSCYVVAIKARSKTISIQRSVWQHNGRNHER
jgi:hypothetical protein